MTTPAAEVAEPALHPLLAALFIKHGCTEVDVASIDAFTRQPGRTLLLFTEDPLRLRETLDFAVIVPELAQAFAHRFRVGVLLPTAARALQVRYGFRRWPALVMLRDGAYIGAIDGLREWSEYVREVERLLEAEPTRPPTVGIAVNSAGGGATACGS